MNEIVLRWKCLLLASFPEYFPIAIAKVQTVYSVTGIPGKRNGVGCSCQASGVPALRKLGQTSKHS